MSRPGAWIFAVCLCTTGCPAPPPPPVPPTAIDDCTGLAAMKAQASPARVKVSSVATLSATGGSGRYRYSVAAGGSGGEVRGDRLVTGPTPGKDKVTVSDDCGNSAGVEVEIIAAFFVAPARATIKPGTSFAVQVLGTLGPARFLSLGLGSAGSISDAGLYTAGALEGLDLIEVKDTVSGEEALLQYQVSTAAAFRGSPAKLALPAGASVPLETVDGSGSIDWSVKSGPGTIDGGVYSVDAAASGVAVLTGKDVFTQETATVKVRVMEELTRAVRPHGRQSDVASIVTGDFDGDGIADVALGVPESDLGRPQGGAVFIFKGSASGLPAAPTWTLVGDTDTAALGTVLAAGDLDGDGKDDLAISEPGADVTVSDSGAVLLYKFGPGGPTLLREPLTGLGRGNFGAALAIADVDGDGDKDLIVGSPGADLAPTTAINSRGVVDFFLLEKGKSIPDLGSIRVGGSDLAPDGTPRPFTGLRFGRALVVADLNGDGAVDLAVLGSINNGLLGGVASARNQNAVAIHFGRKSSNLFAETPDLYLLPSNPADVAEGTWRLGLVPKGAARPALLILAADLLDSPDLSTDGGVKSGANAGGVLLYDVSAPRPTGAAPAMPPQLGRAETFARIWGDAAGISAGRSFAVADLDGDGKPELVLGAPYASNLVALSGKLLVSKRPPIYIVFHKPKGVISMFADPEGRPTLAYIASNCGDNRASTSSTMARMARNGWSFRTRASGDK